MSLFACFKSSAHNQSSTHTYCSIPKPAMLPSYMGKKPTASPAWLKHPHWVAAQVGQETVIFPPQVSQKSSQKISRATLWQIYYKPSIQSLHDEEMGFIWWRGLPYISLYNWTMLSSEWAVGCGCSGMRRKLIQRINFVPPSCLSHH